MKRFYGLVVLMLLSLSAHAGDSYSFVVGGHRIRIDAPRYCGSPSCVSISIPGIYETRRPRERNEDIGAAPTPASVPAKPQAPAPQQASPSAPATPPSHPSVEPKLAAPASPPVTSAPPAPAPKQAEAPAAAPPPMQPVTPPIAPPPPPIANVVASATPAAPQVLKVSREADEPPAETPLGDWRTEGDKGSVRIEPCGRALCGYILDPSSNAVGESVLINMRSKARDLWSGYVYSRASGVTYYGTIAMRSANSLRVEACALGKFFCSTNIWSRIAAKPQEQITSRQISPEPRS